jgi:uncharacterized protein YcaQ
LPAEVQGGTGWVEVDGIFGPTDAACHDALIEAAALTLGVGTVADLADVPRLNQAQTKAAISRLIERGRLQQVSVHTWVAPAYMHLEPRAPGTRRRAVLLSPFDPLVWERDRTERMFGMRYRIESYTPAPKRERGYYAMPVLAGDRLVGTVDPARTDKGATLTARTVVVEAEKESRAATHRDALAIAAALADAASWVGAERIEVEQVRPASARAAVVQAVSEISSRIKP